MRVREIDPDCSDIDGRCPRLPTATHETGARSARPSSEEPPRCRFESTQKPLEHLSEQG